MRTLVIDAHAETADLFSLLLEQHGHESYWCIDHVEGLETAAKVKPDVVLLDATFLKMDGYKLATQLLGIAGLSGLRVIMLSSRAPDPERMQSCGIERHFKKPINLPAVLQQILKEPAAASEPVVWQSLGDKRRRMAADAKRQSEKVT